MKQLFAVIGLVVAVVVGWGVYQQSSQPQGLSAKPAPDPVAVEVIHLQRRDLEERVELVGSLEARTDVQVRSRLRGYIVDLPFDVGDRIEAQADGTLPIVVGLENDQDREAVTRALAALEVARAQLQASQAKLLLAERMAERQKTLVRTGAITKEAADQVLAEREIARAQLQLEHAQVAQAESDVQQSRNLLEQTRIRAPHAGFVAERLVDVGDLANPDDLLLRIVELSTVRTMAPVTEEDYERVQVAQQAMVRVDAFPDATFMGRVVRKTPVLDPQTRTAMIQIEINNQDLRLKPGMHARVSIVVASKNQVPTLPMASLLEHSRTPSIFVVSGTPPQCEERRILTGISNGQFVEVVSGIAPQEAVVTLGNHMIESGQEVIPVPAEGVVEYHQPQFSVLGE